MDITTAIELAERLQDWLSDMSVAHNECLTDENGDEIEVPSDLDIYCDGGYCNLDDAESTADSLLSLLKELQGGKVALR